jgi:hypothetical protein
MNMTEKIWSDIKSFVFGICALAFVFTVGDDIKGWFFPQHPSPVHIEADGQEYIACDTPEYGASHAQGGKYYIEFKDITGSPVSLLGVNKLAVTNLPQMVNSTLPTNPSPDDHGKPYQAGVVYNFEDGGVAKYTATGWQSIKVKNNVCESAK